MTEADALDMIQFAVWITLTASAPAVTVGMAVGVGLALIQALTQIQEITLTFVPKIVAILITVAVAAPFMGAELGRLTEVLYSRISTGF